jgi:hypothetical protein
LIDCRRKELQPWALPLGERLLGEKPGRFRKRISWYWDAWAVEDGLARALPKGTDATG